MTDARYPRRHNRACPVVPASVWLTATFQLFQRLGNGGVEGFASEGVAGGYDLSGGAIDQVGGRDGIDSVELANLCVPELAVVYLRPRHLVRFRKLRNFGSLILLIQADSEDVEAFILVLLIGLDQ